MTIELCVPIPEHVCVNACGDVSQLLPLEVALDLAIQEFERTGREVHLESVDGEFLGRVRG